MMTHLAVGRFALLAAILVGTSVACPARAAAAPGNGPPDCKAPQQAIAADHPLIVTINPATVWQPRGGLVLVEIRGDTDTLAKLVLRACLSWDGPKPPETVTDAQIELRPSAKVGIMNIGIEVPDLDRAEGDWPVRIWTGDQRLTGFGIVPLATLRLLGSDPTGIVLDTSRDVGVTSLWSATITTSVCVVLAIGILHELARRRGTLVNIPPMRGRLPGQTFLLRLITASDGRASLSQLQILLWTFVVGASAVYVMCLSGDLIDVTQGTLALLGIAGASAVLASTQRTPAAPGTVVQPSWTDLIAPEDGSPGTDVKRVQMLFFTVISAAFVLLKVLTTYVIPDIPTGYLLLMGISNGVYIGGKFS